MGASGFRVGRDEVNGGALEEKSTEVSTPHSTIQPNKPDHHSPVVCHTGVPCCTYHPSICQCEAAEGWEEEGEVKARGKGGTRLPGSKPVRV